MEVTRGCNMKQYRAIVYFEDLQNNRQPYNVGDVFPKNGYSVSENRIKELLGSNNKQKRPVIEEVEEIPFTATKYTAKQLESMTIAQIEQLAEDYGYEITKTLKGDIIEEFLNQQ